ncbi:MAG: hypothetical protein QG639_335, partial [Patescibacteria group bacterium]|nr:hypothetical protein [Patescibacteria group bacterium]
RAGNFNPTGWNGYDGSYCPETPVQLAAAVGGWPANWTLRDWSGGADMFAVDRDANNEPLAFYVLTDSHIDGADTWVDYYNTQEGRPDQLANGETFPLADATWHCHDGSDGYVPESSTPNNVQHIPANTQVSTAQTAQTAQQPAQQPSQAPTTSQCYATAADVAAAVGGQAANWTAPDWDGGAWVFHSDTPVKLRIPSAGGKIDHHSLGTITSGETRDAVQDASYTCTR